MRLVTQALTFDDVLLLPAHSTVLPREVDLKTRLTRHLNLNIPLVSAAMDTVTESQLAIALAQEGGLGVIHKNLSPQEQAREIVRVKRYESGILKDPITIPPSMPVREVLQLAATHSISGFPVVENQKVLGVVTNRDLRFEANLNQPVERIMTPQDRLIVVKEGASIETVKDLLHRHRLERVLIVDKDFHLKGLVTVKDILKSTTHPQANKDEQGKLRVGAAVGTGEDFKERTERLIEAGVDVLVMDTAHGHSQMVLEALSWLRNKYPQINIIAGNVATVSGAKALVERGVDAVKVGIGPGSICTTRIVTGVGVPQITAVASICEALAASDIPVIADGGIRYSGDIAKALAAGAHSVMLGGLFAGTDEAPGEIELYQGRSYKVYRGMGSIGAMRRGHGAAERYFQSSHNEKLIPEGIEGRVPYRGPVSRVIQQLTGALHASFGYLGCPNISALHQRAEFVQITSAGMRESHVHNVQITKEAPNYWLDQ